MKNSMAKLAALKWNSTGSKKVWDQPAMTRLGWIDTAAPLALSRQCELIGVARSTVYSHRKPRVKTSDDVALCHMLDELYTAHPFYGTRRMVVALGRRGHYVNRKRVWSTDIT